jgi:glycosyltransferase 2 family protein
VLMGVSGVLTVLGGQRLARTEGDSNFGGYLGLLAVATLVGCSLVLVAILSDPISTLLLRIAGRTPILGRARKKLHAFHDASKTLLAPRQLPFPTSVSVLSWGCEGLALFFIASCFGAQPGPDDAPGAAVTLPLCVFAYSYSMIAGNVAFILPAGIGLTEGLLGWLLDHSTGLTAQSAAAAMILLRACTLWFAVAIGLVCTALFERYYGRVEENDL